MKNIISIQSHVVFGHAGNSSAVFPLQRMGFEVWPIHTVQFSNHTQYAEGWTGQAFSAAHISQLVDGIAAIDQLKNCDALISGYQGSAEQCLATFDAATRLKQANPQALYICDPVMGDPQKGCIVADGVSEALCQKLLPMADVIVPNQFELSQFVEMDIETLDDAIEACQHALAKGPKLVLVKHLHCLSEQQFSMMLASRKGCFLLQRPHLDFAQAPVGVGDLITATFSGALLQGLAPVAAFEHCHNAVYGVLKTTQQSQQWELQTVAAQQQFITPSSNYRAQQLSQLSTII